MSSSSSGSSPTTSPARRVAFLAIAVVLVFVAGWFGYKRFTFALAHEETDDAQIEGHISPVLPRVSGYVAKVLVSDNQRVTAGQLLLEIDPTELNLKIASAEAALHNADATIMTAEAALANARAAAAVASANVATAEVTNAKAAADLARDTNLRKTGAITDHDFDDTKAEADKAAAQLQASRRQAEAANTQVEVAKSQISAARTQRAERQTELDYDKLQRSYASVVAPIAGFVSRKNVEPGQYVQAGQTLLSITSDSEVWAVANFKETQLTHMSVDQPVEISVDTYPGVTFRGKVESIAGATGARFALLPPDNASGNFVKVTQRVPVKITFDEKPDPRHTLRPGISVVAAVKIANE